MYLFLVSLAYQVIQSSHEGFKLMFPNATLVQGPKGGASPAHGAGRVGFMDGPIQHDQVLFTTGTTQSWNLKNKTDLEQVAASLLLMYSF